MKLKYKTSPSFYELTHIVWKNIEFDKELLLKFMKRLRLVKFLSFFTKKHKEEYNILQSILESKNEERINGLLNNDEDICRSSIIEKWSRIGAIELIIFGRYTKDTYTLISNLPIEDYIMIEKRTRELIDMIGDLRIEENNISNTTPGL
jgi:hypothetical protein